MMLRTPVCSYPIIVTHLSFNFLCLLLLYSIYLNGKYFIYRHELNRAQQAGTCATRGTAQLTEQDLERQGDRSQQGTSTAHVLA